MHKAMIEFDEGLLKGFRNLIRSIQRKRLKKELGTYDLDLTLANLYQMRRTEKRPRID
jgi:hypothetical protein